MSKESKDKLTNLKKQLQSILESIDDENSSANPSRTSQQQDVGAQPRAQSPFAPSSSLQSGFASRAMDNFRRAFPALSRPFSTGPAPKRRKLSTLSTLYLVKNTYTATFCCLEKNNEFSPNSKELYYLSCCGLGKKRHSLDKDGNHDYVKAELEKIFPRLSYAEGKFMLYRAIGGGSGKRPLHKIPVGPQGYSTIWLCDEMAIGSACMYVVPFFQLPNDESNANASKVDGNMPMVKCDLCGDSVELHVFQSHACQGHCSISQSELSHAAMDQQIERDRALAEKLQSEEDEHEEESTESLTSTECSVATCPLTLQEAFSNLRIANDPHTAKHSNFIIQRSRVWNNVVQEMKNMEFNTFRMSVEFIGENAADTGGPTREMFSLIYKEVIGSKLTKGSMPNLTFSHDQSSLLANEYKIFGQVIALACLNHASLPHCFCPTLAHYILGKVYNATAASLIDELPADQVEVKKKLNLLFSCTTTDAWNEALNDFDERFDMGINKARITIEEKESLIKMANKHIMISCVAEEIRGFQDGLTLFGVLDALKEFPEEALTFLTHTEVTSQDIRKSFSPGFSLKGSSKRPSEETVIFNFYQFLKQCGRGDVKRTFIDLSSLECSGISEEKQQTLNLSDVLQFISGARHLPPGGLYGEIKFLHDAKRGQRVKANTCALVLSIPVNDRYCCEDSAEFISNIADDIFDSQVFGCV